jgi:hypothetical protein
MPGAGLMNAYSGSIVVEDASGARFHIHEYQSGRLWWRRERLMLDTGELARRVDAQTFEIIATGETFVVCPS